MCVCVTYFRNLITQWYLTPLNVDHYHTCVYAISIVSTQLYLAINELFDTCVYNLGGHYPSFITQYNLAIKKDILTFTVGMHTCV